jgi:hypothetical protein
VPHYPPYWRRRARALLILSRLAKVDDLRATEAVELLIGLQLEDGRWA